MEKYLLPLLEKGDLAGLIAVVAVLVIGFLLRQKNWFSEPDKVVSNSAITGLSAKVGDLDRRLAVVEHDIEQLPTRGELHEMQISMVRLTEKLAALEHTSTSTNRAVARIEDFMIEASKRDGK